jgi:hypothetical protein
MVHGVECSEQIDLEVPWADASGLARQHDRREAATRAALDFSGKEFLPAQDVEQLRKAITFLAGGFAAAHEALANAVPELADSFRGASQEPAWIAARDRAAELWKTRHLRGEMDERSAPATLVFVGANLVTVASDGQRLTFRFDTNDFDRSGPFSLSGWVTTAAATRRATRLTAGRTTWHFDPAGVLTHVTRV